MNIVDFKSEIKSQFIDVIQNRKRRVALKVLVDSTAAITLNLGFNVDLPTAIFVGYQAAEIPNYLRLARILASDVLYLRKFEKDRKRIHSR